MARSKIPFSISGDPTPGYKCLIIGGMPTDYKDDNLKFDQKASEKCDETFIAILGKGCYDYCLIMRPDTISGINSSRGGALNIVLSLPSDKCIIDSQGEKISPAKVLISIKDKFAEDFMSRNDGSLKYLKAETAINGQEESFCKWLNEKYQLEDSKDNTVVMNPQGSEARMVLGIEKIEKLFLDPAYPELKDYSKLIAVTAGEKDGCLNLEIPRPKPYTITVNYKYNDQVYKTITKTLDKNGRLSLADEKLFPYADFTPSSVTLDQIRKSVNEYKPGYSIDDDSNTATVQVKVKDKEYPITLSCRDENGNDCAGLLESITLKSDIDIISVDKKTRKYIAKGSQIVKSWIPQINDACGYEIKEYDTSKDSLDKVTINVKLQKSKKIEVKFKVIIGEQVSKRLPIDLILQSGVREKTLTMGENPRSLDFKGDEINRKWKISTIKYSGFEIGSGCDEFKPSDYKESAFEIKLYEREKKESQKDTWKTKDKYVFTTPKDLSNQASLIAVFRMAVDSDRLETIKIRAKSKDNSTFELESVDGYELYDVLSGIVDENWKIHKAHHYDWKPPQENRKRGEKEYELVPVSIKRKLKRIAYLSLAILSIFAIGFFSGGYSHYGTTVTDSVTVEPIVHVDTVHDTIKIEVLSDNVERTEVEQNVGINGEDKTKPKDNAKIELERRIVEFLENIKKNVINNTPKSTLAEYVRQGARPLAEECKNYKSMKSGLEALYLDRDRNILSDDKIYVICNKFKNIEPSIENLKNRAWGHY